MIDLINIDVINNLSNDKFLLEYHLNPQIQSSYRIKKIYHILWHIFHSFSVFYPEYPTEHQKNQLKNFLLKFKSNLNLFCTSCAGFKDNFIENYDLNMAVSCKNNLIQFFCDYHIYINTMVRKEIKNYNSSIYNITFIEERYKEKDYIYFIENKYNINFLKLFISDQLDDFFVKFNYVKTKIFLEKINFKIQITDFIDFD